MLKSLWKWYKNRKWVYIGYSEWKYIYISGSNKGKNGDAGVMHFYIWKNNDKIRKTRWSQINYLCDEKWTKGVQRYATEIIPWLEGADLWKPIQHPIATQGTVINYAGNQPHP